MQMDIAGLYRMTPILIVVLVQARSKYLLAQAGRGVCVGATGNGGNDDQA